MSTEEPPFLPRLQPTKGLYPRVIFGDGVWDEIISSLLKTGKKRDHKLAVKIEAQVQEQRRRAQR